MKKKDKAKNNNKKFIITEFILGIIVIVCLIALCVAINNKKNSQIDFGQNITSADGGDFKPNYDAGHESNFSFRLADMECNDDCSNVSKVKIGDKELKLGEDYEVKRGSIIIIIYKKVMQALQTGKADITVSIEKDGKTVTVGVHITISNTATPSGTQPAQENQPEMTTNNHSSENNNPTPTQGSNTTPQTPTEPTPTPSESTPTPVPTEDKCKTDIVGFDRPNNCPTHQTRAEYTALGGWESSIRFSYETWKDYTEWATNRHATSTSFLCYASFTIDLDSLTITNISWDDSITPTCDNVRNEHPPLPSEEYLTNYLRSIAK